MFIFHSIFMIINKEFFTFIEAGQYPIGLGKTCAEIILKRYNCDETHSKKEYLLASVPEHTVKINKVLISNKLVSVREFEDFVNESGYITEAEVDGWAWTWENGWKKENGLTWKRPTGGKFDFVYYEENLPVLQISFNDSINYCTWLSEKTGNVVRLPMEAEWEIFAEVLLERGVKSAESIDINNRELRHFCDRILQHSLDSDGCHPTGIIWEWTFDWYKGYPGSDGNKDYGEVYKVLRGGSLFSEEIQKIPQYRFRRCPTARSPFYGLRLALGNNG